MKCLNYDVQTLTDSNGHSVHICRQTGRWVCSEKLSGDETAYLKGGYAPLTLSRFTPTPHQIILNVTSRCNLDCIYCYANEKNVQDITEKVFSDTINFIGKISAGRDCSILLTGGEPMLLWDRILTWINKYRKVLPVNLGYSMQSNGTLINETNAAELRKERVNVGISLDSSPNFHNSYRSGSYELALRAINILRQHKIGAGARITVSAESVNTTPDTIRYYISQGIRHFTIGFIDPLGRARNKRELLPSSQQRLKLQNEMFQICVDEYQNKNRIEILSVSQMIVNLLTNLRPSCCPNSPCGAGVSLLGVNTNGDVYPCDYLFEPSMKLGNVADITTVLTSIDKSKELQKLQYSHQNECNLCAVNSICTGGCRVSRYAYDKENLSFPNCGYMPTLVADYAWKITNDMNTRRYAASIATGDVKSPSFGLSPVKGTLTIEKEEKCLT
ncbi:MAG: radical SAM protein [Planctomycetaceae bacterium]|jgi:uncharacterized protein|nr:radical SAM protein [Planctomycetaceae bacterium]